jgi:hypothetical protein
MDPSDHRDEPLDGADCAACGQSVPGRGIRRLAEREDLAFVELHCPGCGSVSLAILAAADPAGLAEGSDARQRRPPVDVDDVLAMHEFLAAWGGDLRELLSPPAPDAPERRTGAA